MAERNSFDRSSSEVATSPGAAPPNYAAGLTDFSEGPRISLEHGRETAKEAEKPDQNSLVYESVVQSDVSAFRVARDFTDIFRLA